MDVFFILLILAVGACFRGKPGRVMRRVLTGLVLYILLCVAVPPLLRHRAAPDTAAETPAAVKADGAAERVLCLDDNEEALVWRLTLIDSAQERIIMSTHDFRPDDSGRDVMAALLNAADRGVRVEILIDGVNGGVPLRYGRYFRALISSPNVEARFYNPPRLLTLWRINYRMHDKYIVADDAAYILGGRNTHDLFLGEYAGKVNIDRDVLVYEENRAAYSSLDSVEAYFYRVWELACNEAADASGKSPRVAAAREELRERYALLAERYDTSLTEAEWLKNTVPARSVSLLSNPTAAWNKEPELWRALCGLMGESESVVFQTPYIIGNREIYGDITALTDGGTELKFVTNAVGSGANVFGCANYLNDKNRILATGAEIYEYAGERSLHTKSLLLDGSVCVVGSFNLDMRSIYLDTETMLVIDSPALAARMEAALAADMERSLRILPDGTELPGADYTDRAPGPGKTVLYSLLRVLVWPFGYLL